MTEDKVRVWYVKMPDLKQATVEMPGSSALRAGMGNRVLHGISGHSLCMLNS